MAILTEEEERYDRQIRLWGAEAQNNLRNANILLIGATGLGSEIAKNIVLSGIKSLTLVDNRKISEAPAGQVESQMLISFEKKEEHATDNGTSLAELSLARCHELNPLVKSCSEEEVPFDRIKSNEFQIVVSCDQAREQELEIYKACEESNTPFLAGMTAGYFGQAIIDCGNEYKCQVEKTKISNEISLEKSKPPSTIENEKNKSTSIQMTDNKTPISIDTETPKDQPDHSQETQKDQNGNSDEMQDDDPDSDTPTFEEKSFSYPKFSSVCSKFTTSTATDPIFKNLNRRATKNFNQAAIILNLMYQNLKINQENAKIVSEKLTGKTDFWEGKNLEFHNFEELEYSFKGQLAAVTAVVGGFMAQEVIRVASKKEKPFENIFFFDGLNYKGDVLKV